MRPLQRRALQVASQVGAASRWDLFPGRFTCSHCLQPSRNLPSRAVSSRSFSSAPFRLKKSASNPKSSRKTPKVESPDVETHIPDNKATRNRDAEIDPYDYTTLQAGIDHALARLKDSLTKTRDSAGRVSPANLESLSVELRDSSSSLSQKQHTRLGDIASVVPKGGRTLQIFAAEESHVKPLIAAVQASEYSLAPEAAGPSDPNPLCITIPIPPVTAETRQAAAAEAKKLLEKANGEIRNARGESQKRFRTMEIKKLVIVDELRKAHKGMEEVVKKGNEEAKRVYDAAVKALER